MRGYGCDCADALAGWRVRLRYALSRRWRRLTRRG